MYGTGGFVGAAVKKGQVLERMMRAICCRGPDRSGGYFPGRPPLDFSGWVYNYQDKRCTEGNKLYRLNFTEGRTGTGSSMRPMHGQPRLMDRLC